MDDAIWEVIYDPDFPMDYQDTNYVIEMRLKPLQQKIEQLEKLIAGGVDGEITLNTDYNELTNKPSINNAELKGNKTLPEIGVDQTTNKDIDNIWQ